MERTEAVKIIRDIYHTEEELKALETLIPELKESEDERIRKWLYELIDRMSYDNLTEKERTKNEEWKKKVLAWLEKQKDHFRDDTKMVEQKPADWSEEDEKMRDRIIDILNRTFSVYSALGTSSTRPSCPTYKDEIDWLKSLRPQPNAEWDANDKAIVNCIVCCLDGQFISEGARKQCLEWFNKHRRDFLNKPSWKPSEEQMEALNKAIPVCMGVVGRDEIIPLESLYEQLKKL